MDGIAELNEASIIDRLVRPIVVEVTTFILDLGGFWGVVILVGLLPLYVYGYLAYTGRIGPSSLKGRLWGAVALLLTVVLSFWFWVVTVVRGAWG